MKVIRKNKYLLFAVPALLLATTLPAQPYVKAHTSSRKIVIGDPIHVWLEVQPSSPEDRVEWPSFPADLPGLEWVEKGKIDTFRRRDTFLLRQQLTLTAFDSGRYYIPSFTVVLAAKNQEPRTFHTDSFLVEVQTIPIDTTKGFKPIKGIQKLPASWLDYWKPAALVLAGLVLAALLIFYFIKRRKKKAPEITQVPPEKAHERALRLLSELKAQKLGSSGKVKEYYDQLSTILRNYFENRFNIAAMEQTTDELLSRTHKMRDLKPFRKELRMILQTADLAKFAKAEPLPEEQESCMDAAIQIVEQTKLIAGEGVV
jgi:LPXTG-motif cell wall-anchored protein